MGIYQEAPISRTGTSWFCIECGYQWGASQGLGGTWEQRVQFLFSSLAWPSLGPEQVEQGAQGFANRMLGPLAAAGMGSTGKVEPSGFLLAPLLCCLNSC